MASHYKGATFLDISGFQKFQKSGNRVWIAKERYTIVWQCTPLWPVIINKQ